MRLSHLTRFTVTGWVALTLTLASPLVGQGTGTTRDILVLNFASITGTTLPAATGSLEIVDKAGSRMLRASGASSFRVSLPEALPEDFTLEFDVIPKECCNAEDLAFAGTPTADNAFARVSWGRAQQMVMGGGSYFTATAPGTLSATLPGQLTHIMATFEGGTLKVYTNGQRLYTLSERRFPRGTVLQVALTGDDEDRGAVYLARLRVAAGIATPGVNAVMATSTGTGMLSSSGTAATTAPVAVATPPLRTTEITRTVASTTLSPPMQLTATGTPVMASLAWLPPADWTPTGYTVVRSTVGTGESLVLTSSPLNATRYEDRSGFTVGRKYAYVVTALSADPKAFGTAQTEYLPPSPDPTQLVGELIAPAGVRVSWKAVPGATEYVVSGPGFASDARTSTTSISVMVAPPGLNTYRVASVFPPDKVLTAAAAWPGVVVKVPAIPSVTFLTLPNGKGSLAEYNQHACETGKWVAAELVWPNGWCDLPGPNSVANVELLPLLTLFGITEWVPWGDPQPPTVWTTYSEAAWSHLRTDRPEVGVVGEPTFIDVTDLDRFRRVGCVARGTAPNAATLCWALSRKSDEFPDGLGDPDRRGFLSILIQEPNGTHFLLFRETTDPASPTGWKMVGSPTAALDSQGERFLPHVCLACHGGRFDAQTGRVTGATPLALDPRGFEYPVGRSLGGEWQSYAYRVHQAMLKSALAPGVGEYIDDMYRSRPNSEPYIDRSAIPPGWTTQPEIYSKIYRPYCGSCHSAQSGPLGFRSWGDLVREKELVKAAICSGRMPHAEVPFRKFWSEGGEVSLPGWLLGALGYSGCGG